MNKQDFIKKLNDKVKKVQVTVNPQDINNVIGHKKENIEKLKELKAEYPEAEVLAHPECKKELLDLADFIGSTAALLSYSGKSEKTQFIVITHKKKTMEYANTLYGITMQESGVSKLVSVKLTDHEEVL